MSTRTFIVENRLCRWMRRVMGVDRAIAFSIMARGWSSMAGLVTVVLIARYLTREEQGYYYTFGSLVALQIIFELGFSFVILQLASHEAAHLKVPLDGRASGDPARLARLASVLQKSVRWYMVAAVLMFCTLIPAGLYFFATHSTAHSHVPWQLPWILVVLAATFTFQIDPVFSYLDGCGFVPQVARARFFQALAGSLMAWTALLLHHGLFAPAMLIFGYAIVGLSWLYRRRTLLLQMLRYPTGDNKIHWMAEVWPFQWRIAISWLCGYFIFQLFNPVLFAYRGAVEAGRMGMSLSISMALMSVAVAWINTKATPFGAMISRKEYDKLDRMFFSALWQSFAVIVAGALVIWAGVVYLYTAHISFAKRVLDPEVFGLLLITVCVHAVVSAEALYLRAHKQEKFLIPSIVGAAFTALSTFLLGKRFGASGMIAGFLAVTVVVGLGAGTYLFIHYRRVWHAA